jgi:galactofuranose transport system ATP-binding protein
MIGNMNVSAYQRNNNKIILKMKNIYKIFPGVKALSNVNFQLREGEIHALMGENGAGKSTLIKVLTGVENLNAGEIFLNDNRILAKSPHHAQTLGLSTVYQEVNLCPNLSVAENIFIGREPTRFGKINWKKINKMAEIALSKLNLNIDVTKNLESYSLAIQQMVAIARAIDISAKVLIFDEPTSSLDKVEVEKLFTVMRKLKDDGLSIVFVTHFLEQVYEVSDRITVLRNGNLVGEYEISSLSKVQLVAKMIGKDLEELSRFEKQKVVSNKNNGSTFIKARNVGHSGKIAPFDLDIKKGEVIGLVGLLGSGRTEIARVLFGVDKADSGKLLVNNKETKISSPLEAMKNNIALCPEDRKIEGIISDLTVRENIILALQAKKGIFKYIKRKEQERIANEYIKMINIKASSSEQLVKNLSGGNQQKVILARWLITKPELLILDEPTRGIDVGTKAEIQKLIIQLAKEGMAVMFISSELDELIRCCTRMAVLRDRVKIAEIEDENIDEHYIMKTIAGGETDEKHC